MNLALIPARGGSKRIPHKNLRPFCGRPVIEYSIQAAQESKLFSEILVSTDCPLIAAHAKAHGLAVIDRPQELAGDLTPLMPVVKQALNLVGSSGSAGEDRFVCCLLATAPFVTAEDLNRSFALLSQHPEADFVVPVTSFPYPIWRGLEIVDHRLKMIWSEHEFTRSQDLPEAFHDVGQFYWGSARAWLNRDRIFSSTAIPYRLPRARVQDLDTLEDWERAEHLFRSCQSRSGREI